MSSPLRLIVRASLLLILAHQISSAQWFTQQDPFLRIFYDQIVLRDSLHGWAIGRWASGAGGIARTTDGGDTWTSLYRGGPGVSTVVFFSDLVACGFDDSRYGNILVRSMDGGATWTEEPSLRLVEPDTLFTLTGLSRSAWGDSTALWASGLKMTQRPGAPPVVRFNVFCSTDTGRTWSRMPSLPDSGQYLMGLSFRDRFDGFVVSRNAIERTTDGGASWSASFADTTNRIIFESIQFFNGDTGLFVATILQTYPERYLFGHTTDRGATWDVDTAGPVTGLGQGLSDFRFTSPSIGFRATWGDGIVYRTTDGGRSWQAAYPGDHFHPLGAVASLDGRTVIAAGVQGKILISRNGGDSWRDLTPPELVSYRHVRYLTEAMLAAYGSGSLYFLSGDSGKTWTKVDLPSGFGDLGFAFLDSQKVWMCDDSSRIYRSTSSGRAWTVQKFHDPNDPSSTLDPGLRAIAFANDSIGCAVGMSGFVTRTFNGGGAWTPASSGTSEGLLDVAFASAAQVWAVGTNGVILRSIDRGGTWSAVGSPVGETLTSVTFTDTLNGFILGEAGTMLRTTDGGVTWVTLSAPMLSAKAMRFVTNNAGWVVGAGGAVRRTIDGGETWEMQTSGTTNDLWSVDFRSATKGIIVGANATVIRTDNGGGLTGVPDGGTDGSVPAAVELLQNHPNPFNPATVIGYRVSGGGWVRLAVYDLLGREVAVLVNEEKSPGSYAVKWDAWMVPSGVYFYRLTAGEFTQTRRLVLIR